VAIVLSLAFTKANVERQGYFWGIVMRKRLGASSLPFYQTENFFVFWD
jgi:hypothetical protein